MDPTTRGFLLGCFAAGEIIQLVILSARAQDPRMRRWSWAPLPLFIALVVGLCRLQGVDGTLGLSAAALLIYPMAFGQADLMPDIDESYVFSVTVAAACSALVFVAPAARDWGNVGELVLRWPLAAAALALAVALVVLPALLPVRLGRELKAVQYFWFLMMLLFEGGLQWRSLPLGYISGDPYPLRGLDAALVAAGGGMAMTFLIAHFSFAFAMVAGLKAKDHAERRRNRAFYDAVAHKFSDRQLSPVESAWVLGANLAALVVHYWANLPGAFTAGVVLSAAPLLRAQLVKSSGDVQRDGDPAPVGAR